MTRGLGAALVALLVACASPAPSPPAGRGALPKYLSKEQTYWTAVGVEGDTVKALVNEEGMIEVGQRSFSVEPLLRIDDRLVTWNDAAIEPSLQDGDLPIPIVTWRADGVTLTETVFAAGTPGDSALFARYQLANDGVSPLRVALLLALRPFQVNPPWQDLNGAGGASPIRELRRDGRVVWVNGSTAVASLTEPDGFDAGFLESGALRYAFELSPGASREIVLAVPFHAPEKFVATLPAARDVSAYAARRSPPRFGAGASGSRARSCACRRKRGSSATRCAAPSRRCWSRAPVPRCNPARAPTSAHGSATAR